MVFRFTHRNEAGGTLPLPIQIIYTSDSTEVLFPLGGYSQELVEGRS